MQQLNENRVEDRAYSTRNKPPVCFYSSSGVWSLTQHRGTCVAHEDELAFPVFVQFLKIKGSSANFKNA